MKSLRELYREYETLRWQPTAAALRLFEQENPRRGSHNRPARRGPAVLLGVLLLLYALFMILLFAFSFESEPLSTCLWGLALNLTVLLSALTLLVSSLRSFVPEQEPVLTVRERLLVQILGVLAALFGALLVFCASAVILAEPIDGFFFFFAILGIFVMLYGIRAAAGCNRRILVLPDRFVVCVFPLGRRRFFKAGQPAFLRPGPAGMVHVLDSDCRRLFSFRAAMPGAPDLADWLTGQDIPLLPSWQERQAADEAEPAEPEPLEWKEEYRTVWHDHIPTVYAGLVIVCSLSVVGCSLPLRYLAQLGYKNTLLLLFFSPLLPFVYYLLFPGVLSLNGKPKHATPRWKSMHISFPRALLILLALWTTLLTDALDEMVLTVVDDGRELILWLAISAGLCALAVWRTPKRQYGEGLFLLCLVLFLIGDSLAYSINLALCSPPRHTPAQVIERRISEEDDSPDCYLTVRLEDASEIEIRVSQELYRLEEDGGKLLLCQRTSPLGIRMATLHLPEKND